MSTATLSDSSATYTIAEAAALTGLHKNTIRMRVKIGQLEAQVRNGKFGEEYRISHAELVRAGGVLPADGNHSVILYMHGGAFLTCGANSHGRLVTALSKHADSPVLVVNYRMIPKHSVGQATDDCYDAYKWLRLKGYEPDQIAAEPRIYPAYWNWQVYYITTVGDVWLEEGYGT